MTSSATAQLVEDAHRFLGDAAFRQHHEEGFYRALHENGPVLPIGGGYWIVAGYRELEWASRDQRVGMSAVTDDWLSVLDDSESEELRYAGACMHTMLLALDPPE